jgi:hypothetical protein
MGSVGKVGNVGGRGVEQSAIVGENRRGPAQGGGAGRVS